MGTVIGKGRIKETNESYYQDVWPKSTSDKIIEIINEYMHHVSPAQQQDIKELFKTHLSVTQDSPGRRDVLSYDIISEEATETPSICSFNGPNQSTDSFNLVSNSQGSFVSVWSLITCDLALWTRLIPTFLKLMPLTGV